MSQNVPESYPAQDHTEISEMVRKQFTIPIHCFAIYLETTERKDLFRVTNKMPLLKSENSARKKFFFLPKKKKKKSFCPKQVKREVA